jgi:hypothetical protein
VNIILSITDRTGMFVQFEICVQVADMKNSVKDRSNAQCSCAGHFIESHIDPDYNGKNLVQKLSLTYVLF